VLVKSIQIKKASTRTDERFVSLTTTRLHATTVYVVAEVDGTGLLAGQLKTFTDRRAATRAADKLVTESRARSVPQPRPERGSLRPRAKRMGEKGWRITVTHKGKTYKRTFGTEQQAEDFIDFIKADGTPIDGGPSWERST